MMRHDVESAFQHLTALDSHHELKSDRPSADFVSPRIVEIIDGHIASGFAYFLLVAIILQLARALYIYVGGEARIVAFVPDDAFYYFDLAQNFSQTGKWSLDGVAPATGFHLLWGYFIAALTRIDPRIDIATLFVITFVAGLTCYLVAAAALSKLVVEYYGPRAILAVFVVFLGTSVFRLPTLAMEAGPAMMFSSLATLMLCRRHVQCSIATYVAAYSIGVFGMLSRSDFGVTTFCIVVANVAFALHQGKRTSPRVLLSLVVFSGAVTGLALVVVHSFVVSGQFLQSSAQMKLYWSEVAGHSIDASLRLVAYMFFPILEYVVFIVLGLLVVCSAVVTRRRGLRVQPLATALLIGAAYVVLYSRDSRALQPWYAVSFVVPCVIASAPLVAEMSRRTRVGTIAAVGLMTLSGLAISMKSVWSHQVAMKDGGQLLARHPEWQPVGSWNAGLVRFFAGHPVTNLDGLVNDEILPYAKSGTLFEYVVRRKLAYILDYAAMFDPALASRGGYGDGILASCLTIEDKVDAANPKSRWDQSFLTLYRVDQDCLGAKLRP